MAEPIVFKNTPISVYQTAGLNGGQSRRVFITITDLQAVPEELFAIKFSQSKNKELAGKPVFKHFSYRPTENSPFSILAPREATLATPLSELKAEAIAKIGRIAGAQFSLAINLNGKFANINTPDGIFTVFDDTQFAATEGRPGYYIKSGSLATVTLKSAKNPRNDSTYYQVSLATDIRPDDLFVRMGKGKVWGADQGFNDAASGAPAPDGQDAGDIW